MVTATEKQLYLCTSCKRTGVKSKNSKVFETFFCPRCKKETTLFLPREKMTKEPEKPTETQPVHPDQPALASPQVMPPRQEIDPKRDVVTQIVRRRSFTIRDFFVFMLGFVAALLILKTR